MDRFKEFIEDHLYQIIGGMVVVCAGLLLGLILIMRPATPSIAQNYQATSVGEQASINQEDSRTSDNSSSTEVRQNPENTKLNTQGGHKQIYVDVKGAVRNPGVYQVKSNMRICDAVDLAGGFNRSADKKQVNLAKRLTDQQVVYIPIRGEIKGNQFKDGDAKPIASEQSESNEDIINSENTNSDNNQINLNSADKTKLQELTGIGEKKADQIIAYRQAHGNFKKIDELKDVPGFGDKTFMNLKSSICV